MTVWGEGVFLLNAALDYLLLSGAVRLRGGVMQRRRIAVGALMGGICALLALHEGTEICVWLGLPVLLICAFGISWETLRCGALFVGLSCHNRFKEEDS